MCNPIAQALLFNDAKTEFNVMMGLCVGHDSLFLKYAEAPCTVFAVKDRLWGTIPWPRSTKSTPSTAPSRCPSTLRGGRTGLLP
jgi:hypothetical protein